MAKSDWVSQLQEAINSYTGSNLATDGIAGPATLAACPTLQEGNTGDIVRVLQWSLGGQCRENLGYFGADTKRNTIIFQSSKKLVCDGIVGRNTWHALLKPCMEDNGY
jgi:peptidoglycan hydrolase-like protein with peptidoglycan-binding domain